MKRILIVAAAALAAGCATARQAADEVGEEVTQTAREVRAEVGGGPKATARLVNAQGAPVGTVTLEQEEDGVDMEVHVMGLPQGVHGIHIHEVGTCTSPDFASAGGHYNPGGRQHGFEDPQGPHAGDLPNITVGANGMAHVELENERVTLTDGPNTLFDANGSAIVIHATADDYRTNPSGNSGARIACGVIVRG